MTNKSAQAEFVLDLVPGVVKEAMLGTTSSDLWKCNIDDIVVIDEFNVRDKDADYDTKVREYADSMKAHGFMLNKPLALFVARINGNSVNVLYDGHRRLAAAKLARSEGAEISFAPAVTAPKGTSMEDLTIALVTTNNGEPLKPHQIAIVCKRLVSYGMETGEIAQKLGFSKTYVESLLQLMSAPRVIRDMVTNGKVSATLAIDTIKKHGSEAAKVLNDASETAQASGKERVTKKLVSPAKVKVPKRDLLAEGVNWVSERHSNGEYRQLAELLSFLCGVPTGDVCAKIGDQLREKAVATET